MNPALLKSQFERLARDPSDTRLLKQLAVEFGAAVVRGRPEWLREYRVAAAGALRAIETTKLPIREAIFTRGALSALLDAAACAEESLIYAAELEQTKAVPGE